ncbi:dihydrolipoamide acetyltransferase family protein [Staphylococcus capitis]|uniref:dihydrolipoamide acetyltransferase family protein n=1 Tax=Staphylococcus capitis TaxID=29388 RepID=UPI0028795487|nr:dihydrolipoamide acetyltransferase family protein [Staphylococcus capitis]MDS3984701.1 dihydrolipoamide acetyltransferase family protein [Staphylococcus capitis]
MEIKMPKLGESVHEGTIEQWLVAVGDEVGEYEPLCEVITDKVTAEVPSTVSGKVTELIVNEGETVSVDAVICKIDTGEKRDDIDSETEANHSYEEQSSSYKNDLSQSKINENTNDSSLQPKNNGRFSPVVFKLASENNIDLTQVVGTGFSGRVTKKDIEKVINNPEMIENTTSNSTSNQSQNNQSSQKTLQSQSQSESDVTYNQGSTIPVKGVRKAIAQNMVTSVTEIPHGWMMIEADATNLVKARNHHKNTFKQNEGYNLTFFAFFVKAVADALKAHPLLNSTWQGDEIIIHKDINISIAVADKDKLYVPVIKHADEKSIKGIAREINDLATKARNGQLTQADMEGGTFTVNNTGSFGSVSSMGIINHPQAAILQVESVVKKPVVIDDMIAIRSMVNLCISIDHRILDGLQTGQFMNHIKKRIEQYSIENTNIY